GRFQICRLLTDRGFRLRLDWHAQAPGADIAKGAGVSEHLAKIAHGVSPEGNGWVVLQNNVYIKPALVERSEDRKEVAPQLRRSLDGSQLVQFLALTRGPAFVKRP